MEARKESAGIRDCVETDYRALVIDNRTTMLEHAREHIVAGISGSICAE